MSKLVNLGIKTISGAESDVPASGYDVELFINGERIAAEKIILEAVAGSSLVKATVTLLVNELDVDLQNVSLNTQPHVQASTKASLIPELQAYRKNLVEELSRLESLCDKERAHPDVQKFLRQVR